MQQQQQQQEDHHYSGMDSFIMCGKYVRYTNEQVEALEHVYHECPKPSSIRRQQLVKDCPILAHIEPKQIKVWFQNRRCREKQRQESSRLLSVNAKLAGLNKLLMEENERLSKHSLQLTLENHVLRQELQQMPAASLGGIRNQLDHAALASTETSSDSVVSGGGLHPQATPQHSLRAPSPAADELLSIAEETVTEFISKATGTAIDWIQLPGMKPGPHAIGIVAISHGCLGVAARACSLVGLAPSKVAEVLKDRLSWLPDCHRLSILSSFTTGNGGTVELIYTQMYAPTTLAPPRDFYTLRYTTILENRNMVICERSLSGAHEGPMLPPVQSFVRAEILPSGYLISPCEGGGCIIHIVDHMDLQPCSVPEVLRPLYRSSAILAQKTTIRALRHLQGLAQEASGDNLPQNAQQPAALRTLSHRLSRGFNQAVNGFLEDGWAATVSDDMDDVTVMINESPTTKCGQFGSEQLLCTLGGGILCAKASMLLQNVPAALLIQFLREHRSEWADCDIDAHAAAAFHNTTHSDTTGHYRLSLPLAKSSEQEEILEVMKLEQNAGDANGIHMRDNFVLQLCSGIDKNAVGVCSQLVFAPVDVTLSDDDPLLPSGFCVIPLDCHIVGGSGLSRTHDLASTLEGGPEVTGLRTHETGTVSSNHLRSVLMIAFQFVYEAQTRETCAAVAHQYVCSVVASVQRVAIALAPAHPAPRQSPTSANAAVLARHILQSYRLNLGIDLVEIDAGDDDSQFEIFWQHSDAILCCAWKGFPQFLFANRAGLNMLETTSGALQDMLWEKTLDEEGQKTIYADFTRVSQQGYAYLPAGVRISSTGRRVNYDKALAWKVVAKDDSIQCIAFLFMNWSFS
ncbi:unnamed protein product [Sphagnum balticum]